MGGSGEFLGVGTRGGQGEGSGGQARLPPSLQGRQPSPPRHPDSRPPGLKDKGPFPLLVSLPVLGDCVARLFDQTKGIMSVDNCFKYQGFRAGSLGPLVFSVKGIMPASLRISAFPRNDQVLLTGLF